MARPTPAVGPRSLGEDADATARGWATVPSDAGRWEAKFHKPGPEATKDVGDGMQWERTAGCGPMSLPG
jgi:hypothetical protein